MKETGLALDRAPMDDEDLAWVRRVGVAVREGARTGHKGLSSTDLLDKLAALSLCGSGGPKQLTSG